MEHISRQTANNRYFRFNAVCRPHAYRNSTVGTTTGRRVASYVVPVVVFSTVFNIPKFWETELVRTKEQRV